MILNPWISPGAITWLFGYERWRSGKFWSISRWTNIWVLKLFFIQNVFEFSEFLKICPKFNSFVPTCILCNSSPDNSLLHSLISWCVLGISLVLVSSIILFFLNIFINLFLFFSNFSSGISSGVFPIVWFILSSIYIGSYCPIGFTTHNLSLGSGSLNLGVSNLFPLNSIKSSTDLFLFLFSCPNIFIGFNNILAFLIFTNSKLAKDFLLLIFSYILKFSSNFLINSFLWL